MGFLTSDWFVMSFSVASVFFFVYSWNEKAIEWLKQRSLGQREEVLKLMKQMHMQTDEKKVTQLMLASSFGLGFLVFLLVMPNFFTALIFGSIVTIAGWSLPTMYVKSLYEKRCNLFVVQLVDALTLMAAGLRAGLSVQQSMERVRTNLSGPVSQEFGEVLHLMALGASQEQAFNQLQERIPRPDVIMLVTTVNMLSQSGGNMSEIFQTIVETIRERQKIERKIESLTANAKYQGLIISFVPAIMFVVFTAADPSFAQKMLGTLPGLIATFVIVTLQIIGGLMIKKIAKIEV